MIRIMLFAACAALATSGPALAQENAEDAAVNEAFANPNVMTVRNVTRTEMEHGLQIFDAAGKPIGIVERMAGNDVVLADRGREYNVPITEFYAYNQHGKDYFATRVPRVQLEALAAAGKPLAVAN